MLGEVSLLADSAEGASGAAPDVADVSLSPDQVAICWRGDCKYVATLVQQASPAAASASAVSASEQPPQANGHARQGAAPLAAASASRQGAALTTLKIWQRGGCKLHAIGEGAEGLLPVGLTHETPLFPDDLCWQHMS